MQLEKASAPPCCVDAVWTLGAEPLALVLVAATPAFAEPPQAVASRQAARPRAGAIRDIGVRVRRGRRTTRMIRFIKSSSGTVSGASATFTAVPVLVLNPERSSASAQDRTAILLA
jgi:hypothetical protein